MSVYKKTRRFLQLIIENGNFFWYNDKR